MKRPSANMPGLSVFRSSGSGRPHRHRHLRGATLIEMLVAVFVLSVTTTMMLPLMSVSSRTADRQKVQGSLGMQARTVLDEMLREMRAARQVQVSRVFQQTTFVTDKENILFEAPGYNTSNSAILVPGSYDSVAFRFNKEAKTLTETIMVDVGSTRPARSNMVIARNVTDVEYCYFVREAFKSTGVGTFVLTAIADVNNVHKKSKLRAYVNGEPTAFTYEPTTRTVTLATLPPSGADVQFIYRVLPAADGGKWLAYVNSIDVSITLTDSDGQSVKQEITLAGNARMRNRRD